MVRWLGVTRSGIQNFYRDFFIHTTNSSIFVFALNTLKVTSQFIWQAFFLKEELINASVIYFLLYPRNIGLEVLKLWWFLTLLSYESIFVLQERNSCLLLNYTRVIMLRSPIIHFGIFPVRYLHGFNWLRIFSPSKSHELNKCILIG